MNDLLLPAIQKSTGQDLDPYYNLVSLHLKGDVNTGRNYNAFSDASSNNFRLTNNGEVRGSSFSPYGTSWSGVFDGSSSYLLSPANSITIGTNDFAIEGWIYATTITGSERGIVAIGNYDAIDTPNKLCVRILGATGKLNAWVRGTGTWSNIQSTTTIVVNQWYHFAFVRSGTGTNNCKLYVNGVLEGQGTSTTSIPVDQIVVGRTYTATAGEHFSGHISNVRIVNGSPIYTANFNPPTSPLTAVTNTALIACHANRFIDRDNGTGTVALTLNGTLRISSFSPFLETDTTSGSGYFDGSGDYLSIPGNSAFAFGTGGAGTGDFCLEAWVYPNTISTATFDRIVSTSDYNGSGFDWTLNTNSSSLFMSGTSYGIPNVITKTWNHIVYTRSSGVLRGFLNGVLVVYNASVTTNVSAVTELRIGVGYSGSHYNGYINGLRILKGSVPEAYQTSSTTTNTQIFTPPITSISAVTNTQLLTLQERGAYNTVGFQDESEYQHIVTRPSGANVAQGTFSPFSPSGWSVYLDGSATFTAPAGLVSAFAGWGGRTRTWECWIHRTSTATYSMQCAYAAVAANGRWYIDITTNNKLEFGWTTSTSTQTSVVSTSTIPVGWVHLAVTVDSTNSSATTIYLGINGSVETFTNNNLSTQTSTYGWNSIFGTGQYMAPVFTGNFTSLRWSSNLRYTSNYLLPSQTFVNDANTLFLFGQQNRFIDQSANNYTVSISAGTPRVTPFSPFTPVAYDPQVHGGSSYFDGTGDYLSIVDNSAFTLANYNFCIELWIYPTASMGNYANFLGQWANSTTNCAYTFRTSVSQNVQFAYTTSGNGQAGTTVDGSALVISSWNHIVVCRNGTTLSIFQNGVRTATHNISTNTISDSSRDQQIGFGTDGSAITGYMSNLRFVTGNSIYDPTLTTLRVPTTPLPLLDNTSLLLNFTNAGIIDSTGKNVIETYGNAGVVTTAIKKYGTGSMYFDGTDDRLTNNANNPLISLGTGDFTIEGWVYANTVAGERGFLQISDTVGGLKTSYTTGIHLALGPSPYRLNFNVGGTDVSSGSTYIAINTWYHIAATRSSGSVRLFINGTLVGGPTTLTTDLTGQYICVGGYYNTSFLWNGNIDDLRITKGYARYTTGTGANAGQMVFTGTNTLALPTKAHPDRGTTSTLATDLAAPSSVEALLVGGGGAGGSAGPGAGGGAGGFREFIGGNAISVSANTNYSLTVGIGGPGLVAGGTSPSNGNNTIFSSFIATGGGGGGGNGSYNGGNGGSSGGGAYTGIAGIPTPSPTQGNTGGIGSTSGVGYGGGGGGGAGGPGSNGSSTSGGAGGAGASSSITGVSVIYAAGGGGGARETATSGGTGGSSGIGGAGVVTSNSSAGSGTANTGSGGGGLGTNVTGNGSGLSGSGGSGVVILAYPTSFRPLKASLGLVYTIDTVTRPGYRVYRFTSGSGSISW
jgi:hypothetical protein